MSIIVERSIVLIRLDTSEARAMGAIILKSSFRMPLSNIPSCWVALSSL